MYKHGHSTYPQWIYANTWKPVRIVHLSKERSASTKQVQMPETPTKQALKQLTKDCGDPGACSINHIRGLSAATTPFRNKYKLPLPRILPTLGNCPFAENQLLNLLEINYSWDSILAGENRNFFPHFPSEKKQCCLCLPVLLQGLMKV